MKHIKLPLLGLAVFLLAAITLTLHADNLGSTLSDCINGNCPATYPPTVLGGTTTYTYRDDAFSAFVGGDYTVTNNASEVEGRLAVGGNMVVSNASTVYGVGAGGGGSNIAPPNGSDWLIVRGSFSSPTVNTYIGSFDAWGNAKVGGANLNAPSKLLINSFPANGTVAFNVGTTPAALGIDFDAIIQDIQGRSQSWSALPATGTHAGAGSGNTFTGTNDPNLEVFHVTGTSGLTGWGMSFPNVASSATIIINIPGTTPAFNITGSTTLPDAPSNQSRNHILYNFYEATSVTISGGGLEGSVLVPNSNSTTTVISVLNGRLVTGGNVIHQGGGGNEIHNWPFSGTLPATDWGDNPNSYATVSEGSAAPAASHVLTPGLYLGGCVDGETNGQETSSANGDDITGASAINSAPFPNLLGTCTTGGLGSGDEDGLRSLVRDWDNGPNGGAIELDITGDSCLNMWIDWTDDSNNPNSPDGNFADTADHAIENLAVSDGTGQVFQFNVPANTFLADGSSGGTNRTFHTRIRLTAEDSGGGCSGAAAYGGTASPSAAASSGEVEDYLINFSPTAVTLQDFNISQTNQAGILVISLLSLLAITGGIVVHRYFTSQKVNSR